MLALVVVRVAPIAVPLSSICIMQRDVSCIRSGSIASTSLWSGRDSTTGAISIRADTALRSISRGCTTDTGSRRS